MFFWSVFVASRSFYRILVRFFVEFLRPGTTKTLILVESGIEMKKITKLYPEPLPEAVLGSILAQFWTPLGSIGATLAEQQQQR